MSGAIITMRQASPLSNRSFDCHGNQLSLSWPPLVLHVIFGVWGALIMHNQQLGEEGIMANPGVSGTRTASEKVSMGDRLDCCRMRLLLSMQAMNLLPNAILLLEPGFSLPWEFKWCNRSRQAGGDLGYKSHLPKLNAYFSQKRHTLGIRRFCCTVALILAFFISHSFLFLCLYRPVCHRFTYCVLFLLDPPDTLFPFLPQRASVSICFLPQTWRTSNPQSLHIIFYSHLLLCRYISSFPYMCER